MEDVTVDLQRVYPQDINVCEKAGSGLGVGCGGRKWVRMEKRAMGESSEE